MVDKRATCAFYLPQNCKVGWSFNDSVKIQKYKIYWLGFLIFLDLKLFFVKIEPKLTDSSSENNFFEVSSFYKKQLWLSK